MLLDAHERLKFMEYCKENAESCRAMASQIEKLMAHGAADQMARRERQKAAAYSIVALELGSRVEEYTVGPEDAGEMNI